MIRKISPLLFLFFALIFICDLSATPISEPGMVNPEGIRELSWKGWFTIGILVVMFVALIREIKPPDIVMLVAAGVLAVTGIISPRQLLIGFSSDVIVTIALLCVVVRTWEVNGLLNTFSQHVLPKTTHYFKQMMGILVPVATLSAFMNNTVIVLMMTPVLRKYALSLKKSPSKYLIPLSYASIVGGFCTLIGTSTNLIIDGLLRQQNPTAGFSFFELGYVGLPIAIISLFVIIGVGKYFLPDRVDVATAVAEETKEFTGEFIVSEECPLVNRTIKEVSGRYFRGELLVEIERDKRKITSPAPFEVILEGDRLVFAGDINQIAELHAVKGLKSAADPHFKLDVGSSHFSEVVISANSFLVGKTLKTINFRNNYGASVMAVYRDGNRIMGNVGDIILDAGDTLVLLSSEEWKGERFKRDFYYIHADEKLTIFHPWRAGMVLAIAVGMVVLAWLGLPIFLSVAAATLLYVFTKSITIREAQRSIIWNVLLLIASSFAVAKAVEVTGVAAYFAQILLTIFGTNPFLLAGGVLLVVSLFSQVLSNNTAALLLFPIALNVAHLAGYTSFESLKSVGVMVAVGSSCAFMLPTGYQTHMIVYGPGGYHLTDFLKNGVILNFLIILIGMALIPLIWPLS
ncbi:MAG: Sodium-dependent dicarboxylate transporter SdcS [Chlamydiae bacterium]|nr:Sodium-dependent dicarboxylate transporter SdcS [Chlamydiota bacterium]